LEHFDEVERLLLSPNPLDRDEWVRAIRSKPLLETIRKKPLFESSAPVVETPVREFVDWEKTRNDWRKLLESKSTGKSNEEKLAELEQKMDSMLDRYHPNLLKINPKPLKKINQAELFHTMGNLLNLFELEHRAKQFDEPKKEVVETVEPAGKPSREEIQAIAIELQKHRIITELDKIIELVKQRERVSMTELSKLLGMPRNAALERCELLEKNGLISIHYPPLGDPVAFDNALSKNEATRY
jgi:predicted transcriptional regulator